MEEISNLKPYELYYLVSINSIYDEDVMPFDINLLWQKVNNYYRKDTNIVLDYNKEESRQILYKWLQNKTRYELLDELMLHVYNRLLNKENDIDNTDLFFVNNLLPIWNIMEEYQNKIISLMYEDNNCKISSISKRETISIVKDILEEIDPNKEWLNIYEDAINNNHIVYLNELTDEEKENLKNKIGLNSLNEINNACMFLNEQESYIFLNYTNTLADIPNTIHEVVHYIIKYYNKDNRELPILREYPSIFFEMYALNYLKRIGYNEQELKMINKNRIIDTFRVVDDIKDLMYYLLLIIKKGHIDEVSDKKKYNNELKELQKQLSQEDIINIKKEDPNFFNPTIKCHERCDKVTYDLMLNPYLLFNYYPYVIGSYLSDKSILKLSESNSILSMIKYITEKLSKVDAYDIFYVLECNIKELVPTNYTIDNTKSKSKTKKKRKTI